MKTGNRYFMLWIKIAVVIVCLVLPIGISAQISKSKASKNKTFMAANGRPVVVHGYQGDDGEAISVPADAEQDYKVGDIIINEDGEEEIVYAINDDGSFITATPELYYESLNAETTEEN